METFAAAGGSRVLVVEDDASLRRLLEMRLSAEGYTVRVAEDGQVAVDVLESWIPDIIVSDVMMPRMSGLSLCRAVRGDDRIRCLPVILLTARQFDEDVQAVMELGNIEFMNKPFDAAALHAALDRGLHPPVTDTAWASNGS
jgi:DNA-binding response OmpR family regulator